MSPFTQAFDPRFKQGMSRRGSNARGSALTLPGAMPPAGQPQQQQTQQPSTQGIFGLPLQKMMGAGMFAAGPQWPQPPGNPPAVPPPTQVQPAAAPSFLSMFQGRQQQGGGLDANVKAMIDAMTGARVHKGMDGRQIGQQGVDPNIKYMLYAMRGRRHKGMQNQDIY